MENSDDSLSNLVFNDYCYLNKIKFLSIQNSDIYLTDFDFELLYLNQEGKDVKNSHFLFFIINLVKTIIEKTENTTVLNILFKYEVDALKLPFKVYEKIVLLFYSQAALTKFIENKKFYISFPQLFQQEKFYTNIFEDIKANSLFNTLFIISDKNYILETVICNKMNYEEKKKFSQFIKHNNEIEEISKKKIFHLKFDSENDSIKQSEYHEFIINILKELDDCLSYANESFKGQGDLLPFSFKSIALGGSFDHYHMGHNMLLSTALILCKEKLFIGITSLEMISKKANKILLQSFNYREAITKLSCDKIGHICQVTTVRINEAAGPAGTNAEIEALVLTAETLNGGKYVNQIRKTHEIPEVELIFANLIVNNLKHNSDIEKSSNKCHETQQGLISKKMSSTSIRNLILSNISLDKLELLYKSWTKLTIHILKCPAEISHNWFSIIRDNYMQSWRKYHNLNHIFEFVTLAENYFIADKIKDYINVLLSVWFHDIVYVPSRNDNEERSIEVFVEFYEDIKRALVIENTLDSIKTDKVSFYITCTKHHFDEIIYDDNDLNYLLDFDVMSFALEDTKYFEINQRIKFEYRHHLSEGEWNVGRAKFLAKVLQKNYIFRVEEIRNQFEDIARRNILLELENYKN